MRQRCKNPKNRSFKHYGARGVTICKRWDDFENFRADLGERPGPLHTLERIDNSKGYSPDNCRWATYVEQNNNRSNCIRLEYKGEVRTLTQWSKRFGVARTTAKLRLDRGFTFEQAFEL